MVSYTPTGVAGRLIPKDLGRPPGLCSEQRVIRPCVGSPALSYLFGMLNRTFLIAFKHVTVSCDESLAKESIKLLEAFPFGLCIAPVSTGYACFMMDRATYQGRKSRSRLY